MIHVNKERLGDFIGSERKNLGLTQRDLAARRQGDGAISRQALEQAAPKDYSDIRKYLRDVSTAGRWPKSDP